MKAWSSTSGDEEKRTFERKDILLEEFYEQDKLIERQLQKEDVNWTCGTYRDT